MKRRNFTKATRVEIVKRAKTDLAIGTKVCEKCGLPCKRWEIHHLVMDAMETNKSRKLTAADGALWCIPCHKEETKAQAAILAKARDREASHLRANPPSQHPVPRRPSKREERASQPSKLDSLPPRRALYR